MAKDKVFDSHEPCVMCNGGPTARYGANGASVWVCQRCWPLWRPGLAAQKGGNEK